MHWRLDWITGLRAISSVCVDRSGPRGADGALRVGEAVRRARHADPHQPDRHGAAHAAGGARQRAPPRAPTRRTRRPHAPPRARRRARVELACRCRHAHAHYCPRVVQPTFSPRTPTFTCHMLLYFSRLLGLSFFLLHELISARSVHVKFLLRKGPS